MNDSLKIVSIWAKQANVADCYRLWRKKGYDWKR